VRSGWGRVALLDALQTAVPLGLAFVDGQFRKLRVNQVLAKLTLALKDHLGRPMAEITREPHQGDEETPLGEVGQLAGALFEPASVVIMGGNGNVVGSATLCLPLGAFRGDKLGVQLGVDGVS
jgi:hypothetical protein